MGPPELLNPPSWLNYSFGPVVSIDSGGGANRVPSSGVSVDNSSTASTGTTGQHALDFVFGHIVIILLIDPHPSQPSPSLKLKCQTFTSCSALGFKT